eukprot:TRINITY_DN12744_c0_g1_i1.p1 TRINITY_DN12744_c0_g1~~TRINITY_DN12744_c0_g1_i1.p1  ORF type:complete len:179 (+),score=73.14 TRINITY_DN12744_c0_g1_i1:144-680(+)
MATMLQRFVVMTMMAFVLIAYIAAAAEEEETTTSAVTAKAAVADATETAAGSSSGKVPRSRPVRSLLQACRKDVATICTDKKALVKCLAENTDKITDETCKTWVGAREVCMKAAKGNAACGPKDSARQCLRSIDAAALPEECTSSDFFKSVKMFGMFRRSKSLAAKKDAKPAVEVPTA